MAQQNWDLYKRRFKKIGVHKVMGLLEEAGFKPTKNMIYAIEGALVDKDWRDVAKAYKRII